MTTKTEAANWIMNSIFEGAYDAAGCIAVSQYHEFVLHEQELEDAGELNTAPQFKANRAELAKRFDPEFLQKIRDKHNALPEHRFLP